MVGGRRRQRLRRRRPGPRDPRATATSASPGRIARAIVAARPIETTTELAAIVTAAIPAPPGAPAAIRPSARSRRSASRSTASSTCCPSPRRGDRGAVPGRPRRRALVPLRRGPHRQGPLPQAETGGCECPPDLPCVCGAVQTVRLVRGVPKRRPTPSESNPRAASARLRVAEKWPEAAMAGRCRRRAAGARSRGAVRRTPTIATPDRRALRTCAREAAVAVTPLILLVGVVVGADARRRRPAPRASPSASWRSTGSSAPCARSRSGSTCCAAARRAALADPDSPSRPGRSAWSRPREPSSSPSTR